MVYDKGVKYMMFEEKYTQKLHIAISTKILFCVIRFKNYK